MVIGVLKVTSLINILIFVAFKRRPPEISIEWSNVTIEIKVCAPEIQPEDRSFVRWVISVLNNCVAPILDYPVLILTSLIGIILSLIRLYFVMMTWMPRNQGKERKLIVKEPTHR